MSGRVQFVCDGAQVEVDAAPGETLLSVLRERLGITSVKDGCAPQGQCGCCTVLVDGAARVACVTPVARIAGREVTTVDGLPAAERDKIAAAFVATGGSQCGFCTPGIIVRAAALRAKGPVTPVGLDRALAAHLCRCTGWRTIIDAINEVDDAPSGSGRSLDAASRRAELEGGVAQRVGSDVALGQGGFADDAAPRDALVAVPKPPGSDAVRTEAAGIEWVVADSLFEARELAGKVQGRRTTVDATPPFPLPQLPEGGVRLATSWVEPAYLEPDASWCNPGGHPASPLANGGAFGGKAASPVAVAARELADRHGRAVRVLFSREDVVRLGPKRPPFAASAVLRDGTLRVDGVCALEVADEDLAPLLYLGLENTVDITCTAVPGPPVSRAARAAVFAELCVLQEGALDAAGFDRAANLPDERAARVFLDNVVAVPNVGSLAAARVIIDPERGALERVEVRVAAGDPLDEVALRSYVIGAAHMALGWVLSEGLAVDPESGEVHDLTIRSFGVIRAKDTPPIEVTVVDDPGPPLPRVSDAVFAAVAASTWNALTRVEGARPEAFPAQGTRTARMLRT
ncbi:MAG: 2Fe-2S iron-sulfur cluster-binding protein [Acidimicrobiia bacterium]